MSLLLIFLLLQAPAATRQLEGVVLDSQGLPITGAQIVVVERPNNTQRNTVSAADGFRLQGLTPALYDVVVEADGFARRTVAADLRDQATLRLEVRLDPASINQEVIVAATRTEQRIADLPASATVVRSEQIRETPAVVADDVLRQLPTFSLFRRTSSLAAHPTAQGVSLRGIGPSGVSRTLVLLDGIPFNDPFGGWVYWTRVPLTSVERIEMVDGASSSVYGNYAMGGVINVVTAPPQRRTFVLKPQYGGRKNPRVNAPDGGSVWDGVGSLDFFASDVWGDVGGAVEGSLFNTNGYPIVIERERGLVDTKATVNYQNLNVKLDYTPSGEFSTSFRTGYFSEDRSNAKICRPMSCEEANDTLWKYVSGGIRYITPDQSDIQFKMFANFETFHSNFLAVPAATPPRSLARVTLTQKVPSKDVGGMLQWSKAFGGRHYVTMGTDWRWVRGDTIEDAMNATSTAIVLNRIAGGMQRSLGVFIQDLITVTPRLNLTLSARLDNWRNYNARNLETTLPSGAPSANHRPSLPDKENTVGSPRVAALYRLSDSAAVWGGLSWGFRAPTLNELYRQFQVGAVLTRANDVLGPERLVGGEVGVNLAPRENLTWRTTWFVNRFTNPVSNVTIVPPATPGGAETRQRQNLGRTRIIGIQTDLEYRVSSSWRVGAGYLYDVAKVREFSANTALVGKWLPQVPQHRGSLQITYSNPEIATISGSAQIVGGQYDNDQNTLWLPYYGTVDTMVSRTISANLETFFGIQNIFDREFLVQRNPTSIGAPRLITGGLRITFSGQ